MGKQHYWECLSNMFECCLICDFCAFNYIQRPIFSLVGLWLQYALQVKDERYLWIARAIVRSLQVRGHFFAVVVLFIKEIHRIRNSAWQRTILHSCSGATLASCLTNSQVQLIKGLFKGFFIKIATEKNNFCLFLFQIYKLRTLYKVLLEHLYCLINPLYLGVMKLFLHFLSC